MELIEWDRAWSFELADVRQSSARAPVVSGDKLFQVFHYRKGQGFASTLVALDAATGAEHWRQTFDHVANEPIAATDGTLILSLFSGEVHAFDPSGERMWATACGQANLGRPCLAGDRILVAEIGGRARHTHCLDAASGAIVWRSENGGHAYRITATPQIAVHATSRSGTGFGESTAHLTALSVETGNEVWSVRSEQQFFQPLIRDDIVWVGARGSLRAHRLIDASPVASLDLPQAAAVESTPVPIADGVLVADDTGTIRRVRLQVGRRLFQSAVEISQEWAWSIPDEILGDPVDLGGAFVAFLGKRGVLHVLNAATGQSAGPLLVVENGRDVVGGIAGSTGSIAIAFDRRVEVYRMLTEEAA